MLVPARLFSPALAFVAVLFVHLTTISRGYAWDEYMAMRDDGSTGILRVGTPLPEKSYLAGGLNAGYAFFESMDPVPGAHHRLANQVALAAAFPRYLTYVLSLESRLDAHPKDADGDDLSFVLEPRLLLRGGFELKNGAQLGAEISLVVPGQEGRNLIWEASTLTGQLLGAYQRKGRPWLASVAAGFRMNQSAEAIPVDKILRTGDWISSGLSDFHSVIFGIGGGYVAKVFSVLAEFSGDIQVGDGAPPAKQSPLRIGLTGRYAVSSLVQLSLSAEVLVSERPEVDPTAGFVLMEPRLSVTLGALLRFGLGKQIAEMKGQERSLVSTPVTEKSHKTDAEDTNRRVNEQPASEPDGTPKDTAGSEDLESHSESPGAALITTTIQGRLLDDDGHAIPDATVTLTIGSNNLTAYSGEDGVYTFHDVEVGAATVTTIADGYETVSFQVQVSKDNPRIAPVKLEDYHTGSQLRGLVRTFNGKPVRANVKVEPGGITAKTDEEGLFSLDVAPGKYKVTITAWGFKPQTVSTLVEENGVSIVNVELRKKAR